MNCSFGASVHFSYPTDRHEFDSVFIFSWSIFHYIVHVDKNNQSKSWLFFMFCFFPHRFCGISWLPRTKKTPADVGAEAMACWVLYWEIAIIHGILGCFDQESLPVMWPFTVQWLYDDISNFDDRSRLTWNCVWCQLWIQDIPLQHGFECFKKTSVDVTKLMHDNQKHEYPNTQVILLMYSQCMFGSKYRHEHHPRQCKPLKDKWPNNRCFVMSQDIPLLNMFKWMREGMCCQTVCRG